MHSGWERGVEEVFVSIVIVEEQLVYLTMGF